MNTKNENIMRASVPAYVPAGDHTAGHPARPESDVLPIGAMARQFGVTLRALRFYEDRGLLQPKRVGASRYYTAEDCRRLGIILLGKRIGMSIVQIRELSELSARLETPNATPADQRAINERFQHQLALLEQQRSSIGVAIDELQQLIAKAADEAGNHKNNGPDAARPSATS